LDLKPNAAVTWTPADLATNNNPLPDDLSSFVFTDTMSFASLTFGGNMFTGGYQSVGVPLNGQLHGCDF
jgi:hypothetical protein